MRAPTWAAVALAGLLATGSIAAAAAAESFPSRPIELIVPLAPGSTTDAAARLLADRAKDTLGTPIVIVNKPGAGTTVGIGQAARARPDGHTLVMTTVAMAVNPVIYGELPYDALRDLQPISLLIAAPMVLVANPEVPANSVADLIAQYKDGKVLNFASGGAGTMLHLAGEVLKLKSGLTMKHIPYKGGNPALKDVVAGHVPVMFTTPLVKPQVDSGRVRALAVTGPDRLEQMPGVPTFAEAGLPLPEVSEGAWFGLMAPAGTPPEAVARLNAAFNGALADPKVRGELANLGLLAKGTAPEEFGAFIKDEMAKWPPILADLGLKPGE